MTEEQPQLHASTNSSGRSSSARSIKTRSIWSPPRSTRNSLAVGPLPKARVHLALARRRCHRSPATTATSTPGVIIQLGTKPGASRQDLRGAYLARILAAGRISCRCSRATAPMRRSGCPRVYTALLTSRSEGEPRPIGRRVPPGPSPERGAAKTVGPRRPECRAQARVARRPGQRQEHFVNFVALSMAGELLGCARSSLTAPCTRRSRLSQHASEEPEAAALGLWRASAGTCGVARLGEPTAAAWHGRSRPTRCGNSSTGGLEAGHARRFRAAPAREPAQPRRPDPARRLRRSARRATRCAQIKRAVQDFAATFWQVPLPRHQPHLRLPAPGLEAGRFRRGAV